MESIINLSYDFLSHTYSSIEANINNYIEFSSFNENFFGKYKIYFIKLKILKKTKLLQLT